VRVPGRIGRRRPSRRIAVLFAVLAVAVLVPVAVAAHFFGDVPDTNPHHDDITALAQAGVTVGCGPNAYCPEHLVRRDQMASFMIRGFGRVAHAGFPVVEVPEEPSTVEDWSVEITPGLPQGTLPGATGFVKADAKINLLLVDETGCPCTFGAGLMLEGEFIDSDDSYVTLTTEGEFASIPLTGAGEVTSSGPKQVEVAMWGTGGALANGDVTATYFPLGATGGNTLSPPRTQQERGSLLERASELRR
jgi:hypothetical protein